MKINERSKKRSRFIQHTGTPRCGSMRRVGTLLRTLMSHRPHRDTRVAAQSGRRHTHPFRAVRAAVFPQAP